MKKNYNSVIKEPIIDDIDIRSLLGASILYGNNGSIKSNVYKLFNRNEIIVKKSLSWNENNRTVIFQRNTTNRKDYYFIEEDFIRKVEKNFNIIEISFGIKKHRNVLKNLKEICRIRTQVTNNLSLTLDYFNVLENKKTYLNLFEKYNIHSVIVFCDVHLFDNYLTQLANKQNIATYTLQHGMFHYNQSNPECNLHFINSPAKNMFVWGEYTRRELQKYSAVLKENIFITGNPKIEHVKKRNYDSLGKKTFLVILDYPSESGEFSNDYLIKLANSISKAREFRFDIRPHPSSLKNYSVLVENDKNTVIRNENKYQEIVDCYDFILLHDTSMYYELISLGIPCFKIDEIYDESDFFENFENYFTDNSEDLSGFYIANSNKDTFVKGLQNNGD